MVAKVERQFNTFIKGLITEASPLTFPENSSIVDENFVLLRDGSRKRRLGLEIIQNTTSLSTGIAASIFSTANKQFLVWEAPSGSTLISIGVIRIYNKLWFCSLQAEDPLASLYNGGVAIELPGLLSADIQATSINGNFVIVSEDLPDVITLSYIQSIDTIVWEKTPIMVRDIWGVDDGLDLSTRPTSLSVQHRYNLWNQGWSPNVSVSGISITPINDPTPRPYKFTGVTSSTIASYISGAKELSQWQSIGQRSSLPTTTTCIEYVANNNAGKFPSNSDIWHAGRIEDVSSASYGYLSINPFLANNTNNTDAPKGAFILDIFNRGTSRRNLMAGATSIPLDREEGRFTTVASYSGRVFYSGVTSSITDSDIKSPNLSNYILFTSTITSKDKLSLCYQEADPTSPEINDLIASDGGTIQIPEAGRIIKLLPVLGSLLVFASNGIWEVFGDSSGFNATSYQLNKVSSIGVLGAGTIVEVNGTVLYWSTSGIFALSSDPTSGRFRAESISLGSIQTYYNSISDVASTYAMSYFEEPENRVRWLFNDSSDYSDVSPKEYNKELVFDLSLQAFYTNTLAQTSTIGVWSYFKSPKAFTLAVDDSVYVDEDLVYADSDLVYVEISSVTPRAAEVKFLTFFNQTIHLMSYSSRTFLDFSSLTGGIDYTSQIITGYDLGQSLTRKKYSNYIYTYFKKTEDGFNSDLSYSNPSGCMLQTRWDWHISHEGGKWSTPYQAYRMKRPYVPVSEDDSFDNGEQVIVTKNKVRGSGKALSLFIYSEPGKDLHILGWGYDVIITEVS